MTPPLLRSQGPSSPESPTLVGAAPSSIHCQQILDTPGHHLRPPGVAGSAAAHAFYRAATQPDYRHGSSTSARPPAAPDRSCSPAASPTSTPAPGRSSTNAPRPTCPTASSTNPAATAGPPCARRARKPTAATPTNSSAPASIGGRTIPAHRHRQPSSIRHPHRARLRPRPHPPHQRPPGRVIACRPRRTSRRRARTASS